MVLDVCLLSCLGQNLIIKKYVLGVEGGVKIMEAAGFVEMSIKGKQYLCVEKPDTETLQIIIDRYRIFRNK